MVTSYYFHSWAPGVGLLLTLVRYLVLILVLGALRAYRGVGSLAVACVSG